MVPAPARSRAAYVPAASMCLLALLLLSSLRPATSARPLPPAAARASAVDLATDDDAKVAVVLDKYAAPLLLAMLPRGPVPPSGPSGGTN